jgi:hypothetical protein
MAALTAGVYLTGGVGLVFLERKIQACGGEKNDHSEIGIIYDAKKLAKQLR